MLTTYDQRFKRNRLQLSITKASFDKDQILEQRLISEITDTKTECLLQLEGFL